MVFCVIDCYAPPQAPGDGVSRARSTARAFCRTCSISTVSGCVPPSTRRAIRSVGSAPSSAAMAWLTPGFLSCVSMGNGQASRAASIHGDWSYESCGSIVLRPALASSETLALDQSRGASRRRDATQREALLPCAAGTKKQEATRTRSVVSPHERCATTPPAQQLLAKQSSRRAAP